MKSDDIRIPSQKPLRVVPIAPRLTARMFGQPIAPHRHEFQEVIVLTEGEAQHSIDGSHLTVNAPAVILVAEGKMHLFTPSPTAVGWAVRFTNEFLPLEITELFSQFLELSTIPIRDEHTQKRLQTLVEMMREEERHPTCGDLATARHLLGAFLHLLQAEKRRLMTNEVPEKSADYSTFYRFLNLLDEQFRKEKSVTYYADKLGVTARKLGEIAKEIFGSTTGSIIEQRSVIEAKRLLAYSEQTVQEIAYTLGFEDHSYFTKVFRKNTGFTPSEFREKHKLA